MSFGSTTHLVPASIGFLAGLALVSAGVPLAVATAVGGALGVAGTVFITVWDAGQAAPAMVGIFHDLDHPKPAARKIRY